MHAPKRIPPTLASLLVLTSIACAPVTREAPIPPAPIRLLWPEPAFSPDVQCRGQYARSELDSLFPSAQVALWLPGTRAVELDAGRRCINVIVEDVDAGRLAALALRGAAVPRRAVLLTLAARVSP